MERSIYGRDMKTDLTGLFGICEATNEEKSNLWMRFAQQSSVKEFHVGKDGVPKERWINLQVDWIDQGCGYLPIVTEVFSHPITVSLMFAAINRRRVLFWHSPSQLTFYPAIEKWLKDHIENYDDLESSDATNFCNVIHAINRANEKDAAQKRLLHSRT